MNALMVLSVLAIAVVSGRSPTSDSTCTCNKNYFSHYEAKGCYAIYTDGCNCPIRYECDSKGTEQNPKECYVKSRVYQPRESIPSTDPCHFCYCQEGDPYATIECMPDECFLGMSPLNSSCYYFYEKNSCCGRANCSPLSIGEKTCKYNGKTYRLGMKFQPEDPCQTCTCTENWNGVVDANSCRTYDCTIYMNRKKMQGGCIPIYLESGCCPIQMYCGKNFRNQTTPKLSILEINTKMFCTFKGMNFKVGHQFEVKGTRRCVTCTCKTPPDFTCIKKSCPGPPNNDYQNCDANYSKGVCCPTYKCASFGQAPYSPYYG